MPEEINLPRRTRQENQRGPAPRGNRPKRNEGGSAGGIKTFSTIIMVIATVVLCVLLAKFILNSASDLFGLNQDDHPTSVTIPSDNMTFKELGELLYSKGVVGQKLTFTFYTNFRYKEPSIKAGTYEVNSNMSYDQIITIVSIGDLTDKEVTITFTEDMTLDDVANLLEENGVCNGDDFLEYLQKEDFMNYSFYNRIPKNENRYLKMEGYIFPDTYDFFKPEKVSSVAEKFLGNFDRHINNDNMINRMDDINMTFDEVITLASIIQKEAGDPTEMRRVSSVFHNRLDNAGSYPRLESDVTLNYAENHIKGQNRYYTISSTQEVLDAYNTYVCTGLPAGPICNPGEDAIMAALYPAQTNYYYFVTDTNGDYYYATSLGEHNQYVAEAKKQDDTGENKIGGIATHEPEDSAK